MNPPFYSMGTLPIILLCVGLNTLAQLLMKKGLLGLGAINLAWSTLAKTLWQVAGNPWIIGGVGCFVISLILWLIALSRLELGVAYPMMSLGYVFTAVLGYWLLGENLTPLRLFGIFVIMMGVYFVSRT